MNSTLHVTHVNRTLVCKSQYSSHRIGPTFFFGGGGAARATALDSAISTRLSAVVLSPQYKNFQISRTSPQFVRGLLRCYLEDEELTSELVAPSLTVIETQVFFDGREVGHGGYYRISRRSDTNGLIFKDIHCYSRLNTMVQLYIHKVIKVHAMVAARLTVSLSLTTCGVRNLVSIEGHKRLLSTRARQ